MFPPVIKLWLFLVNANFVQKNIFFQNNQNLLIF